MEASQEVAEKHPIPQVRVEIHVNEQPVVVVGHRHTGLEIKEAAIAQHVKIQLDFLLYLLLPNRPNKLIGDEEDVTGTKDSRFRAIADDDNS